MALPEADFQNPPVSGDNDAWFDLQWGAQAIDLAGAWNQGYRGRGATVAVLDSGVSCQHPDIAANLLPESTSFVPGEGVCHPFNNAFNHGTHVAGIIAAPDNGTGTIGVAPEAKILAVKVLADATGSGSFGGIIQGIVYAADHGADVINMSLGIKGGLPVNGPGANDVAELINATKRAVAYARKHNALTIVSTGNEAVDFDHASGVRICDDDGGCYVANLKAFPAQLPNVLITNVTCAFRKVMNPRLFRGRLQLDRAYCLRDRAFWECSLTYSDDEGTVFAHQNKRNVSKYSWVRSAK